MTMPKFEPVIWMGREQRKGYEAQMFSTCKDAFYYTPLHSADQLTEAYEAGKREQADEQLAAAQAKNVGLRELVEHFALIDLGRSVLPDDFGLWVLRARKALTAPSDTSALEAIVKKAGEVMREKCITAAGPEDSYQDDWIRAKIDACEAIRAIPAVTLEDLK